MRTKSRGETRQIAAERQKTEAVIRRVLSEIRAMEARGLGVVGRSVTARAWDEVAVLPIRATGDD